MFGRCLGTFSHRISSRAQPALYLSVCPTMPAPVMEKNRLQRDQPWEKNGDLWTLHSLSETGGCAARQSVTLPQRCPPCLPRCLHRLEVRRVWIGRHAEVPSSQRDGGCRVGRRGTALSRRMLTGRLPTSKLEAGFNAALCLKGRRGPLLTACVPPIVVAWLPWLSLGVDTTEACGLAGSAPRTADDCGCSQIGTTVCSRFIVEDDGPGSNEVRVDGCEAELLDAECCMARCSNPEGEKNR